MAVRRFPGCTALCCRPVEREVYLKPFQAAREAGVATYMTAFNDLNGVPASGNAFTVRQVLRNGLTLLGVSALERM